MADQNVVKEIENTYFRHYQRRGGIAPRGTARDNLFWRALEHLVEDATPEFHAAVEIDNEVALLIVIDGSAVILTPADDKAVTDFVGRLEGGRYEERLSLHEDGYAIECRFEHKRLPGTLIVRADRWDRFGELEGARAMFTKWASSAPMSRVQTFLPN